MAYVSQEMKARLAPNIREICKRYGVKASLAVRNHMTLELNVRQGSIDFIGNTNRVCSAQLRYQDRQYQPDTTHISVNTYWYHEHFDGVAQQFLKEVIAAMYGPDYFDHSDSQSDYFHCSHYIEVNIGRWNRPYALEK